MTHASEETRDPGLPIRDVAARTGVAAGTIRMWEQRYGFPRPRRTASGYRRYAEADVETIRRVLLLRRRGMSVPAALERAQVEDIPRERATIFGAIVNGGRLPVRTLRKRTLLAMSRAIEDETMARADGALVFGAFQQERFYRAVEHRYQRLASVSDAVVVLADFDGVRHADSGPTEVPIDPDEAIGHEWAVIVDAPGFPVCLVGWEQPRKGDVADRDRTFEAFWTLDPRIVRKAALAAAACVRQADEGAGETLDALLADRPLALEQPVPGLEGLVARMIDYLER